MSSLPEVLISHSELSDPELFKELEKFFHRHTNRSFHPKNILFQARLASEHASRLVGVVRLCHEENRSILRSMEIQKEYQRRGVGTLLLHSFAEHLDHHQIRGCYCLPYDHLIQFYGQIGFQQIEDKQLPRFLELRLEAYRRKRPEARFTGMVRK